MAKTAFTQFQEQIDAMRREAYAAGYAAAMQSVRDFTSQPRTAAAPGATAAPRAKRAVRQAPARSARSSRAGAVAKAAARAAPRPQRGKNARMIEEILQAIAPRAARPTEIRDALRRDKGVSMAFTSIRHALGQLQARRAVEQVADSRTWRVVAHGGASAAGGG